MVYGLISKMVGSTDHRTLQQLPQREIGRNSIARPMIYYITCKHPQWTTWHTTIFLRLGRNNYLLDIRVLPIVHCSNIRRRHSEILLVSLVPKQCIGLTSWHVHGDSYAISSWATFKCIAFRFKTVVHLFGGAGMCNHIMIDRYDTNNENAHHNMDIAATRQMLPDKYLPC